MQRHVISASCRKAMFPETEMKSKIHSAAGREQRQQSERHNNNIVPILGGTERLFFKLTNWTVLKTDLPGKRMVAFVKKLEKQRLFLNIKHKTAPDPCIPMVWTFHYQSDCLTLSLPHKTGDANLPLKGATSYRNAAQL